jgi:hypothetical protein
VPTGLYEGTGAARRTRPPTPIPTPRSRPPALGRTASRSDRLNIACCMSTRRRALISFRSFHFTFVLSSCSRQWRWLLGVITIILIIITTVTVCRDEFPALHPAAVDKSHRARRTSRCKFLRNEAGIPLKTSPFSLARTPGPRKGKA